jgi:[ribosomal protein S5]-alanine N-acetyltransferase
MRPLQTERLLLREFRQEDLGGIICWEAELNPPENDEIEAQKFLDFCFREYRESGIGPWGMWLKKTGLLVGNCGLPHISFKQGTGEVNYYVARQFRGQGLATEALGALLGFGFGDIGLTRIQGRCAPDNKRSERVMQKAGMKFERMIRSDAGSDNASRAEQLFGIMQYALNPPSE